MLVDYTYFFGDLQIGQLSQTSVQDNVSWFIQQYEPEYMEGVLGYMAYKEFTTGIAINPIPSKWTDLIYGAEYTDINGLTKKWKGFLRPPANSSAIIIGSAQIDIVVGRGRQYDPAVGNTSVTIPPALVGTVFWFFQRGNGFLRADEFSISGNQLTLLNGVTFSRSDTYFYFGDQGALGISEGLLKKSPIANYVYYNWMRNQISNTVGIGEVKTGAVNAHPVSPKYKMMKAWNNMVDDNKSLYDFLVANQSIYTSWYAWASVDNSNVPLITYQNTFGI
jgi:hypothetical protein